MTPPPQSGRVHGAPGPADTEAAPAVAAGVAVAGVAVAVPVSGASPHSVQ
jgi:hypothetical protein